MRDDVEQKKFREFLARCAAGGHIQAVRDSSVPAWVFWLAVGLSVVVAGIMLYPEGPR